jgi:E3 ubiquitin-protein ligase NRDP1
MLNIIYQLYDNDLDNYVYYKENPEKIPDFLISKIYKPYCSNEQIIQTGIPFSSIINPNIFCNELKCPICFEFPLNPIQCTHCETIFCSYCINKSLKNNQKCPECRSHFEECKIPRKLRNMIELLEFKCIYHGCNKILNIMNYSEHVNNCSKRIKFKCNLCSFIGNGINVYLHALDCGLTIRFCNFCKRNFYNFKFEEHFLKCKKLVVSCLFCKKSFEVFEMEKHFKKCFNVRIMCIKCGYYYDRNGFILHNSNMCLKNQINDLKKNNIELTNKNLNLMDFNLELNNENLELRKTIKNKEKKFEKIKNKLNKLKEKNRKYISVNKVLDLFNNNFLGKKRKNRSFKISIVKLLPIKNEDI